ncbi:peptidylprolyl isomerase [Kaarinaea lacus]
MKNISKDPLFHFLLIGFAIFALYGVLNKDSTSGSTNVINVVEADIDQLRALWQKQWQRPPTKQELDGLVESHIREQVFYREALAMGLDKDDTIVRRRLMQKMEFLVADVSLPEEPAASALQEYYQNNLDRYREPARLSFTHIYFNVDQRGERAEQEAKAVLGSLIKTGANSTYSNGYGDRFMLQSSYIKRTADEIARDFGQQFVEQLSTLSPQQWHGPLRSGYGLHLVYISEVQPSRVRELDEVKEQVKNDYLFDLRNEANNAVYQKLRERYEISVAPYS